MDGHGASVTLSETWHTRDRFRYALGLRAGVRMDRLGAVGKQVLVFVFPGMPARRCSRGPFRLVEISREAGH